jgi:hypothetical protein
VATPDNASSWLIADPASGPLHFALRGSATNTKHSHIEFSGSSGVRRNTTAVSNVRFVPYYEVQDELFEVYPAIAPVA